MLSASSPSPVWAEQAYVAPETSERELREELLTIAAQLDAEYLSEWLPDHVDIINFVQPGRGEFWPGEALRGSRKDARVINDAAQDASGKLTAAIDTSTTSEAREWFVIGPENPLDGDDYGVREYGHEYQETLSAFVSRIGFYGPNRNAMSDEVGPGTGLVFILDDPKLGGRCVHCPVGTYRLGVDPAGEVNLVVRRFVYNAHQMAQEFGLDKCSPRVRQAIRSKAGYTAKFTVLHITRERVDREVDRIDAVNMPWASYWLEAGEGLLAGSAYLQGQNAEAMGPTGLLRESGYNERPFYCYRWDQLGTKAYGVDSPGKRKLADTMMLQDLELGDATLLAKIMDPPMNEPEALKNGSTLPGAHNPLPDNVKVKYEPSVVIPPEAVEVSEKVIDRVERRIGRGFYGDLLFLLSADNQAQARTAEEIRGKKDERLLQLGSVAQRNFRELRSALKRMAALAHRAGVLPRPPPALLSRKVKLRIEFQSPLLAAQKAVGAAGMQQVVSFGLAAAQAVEGGFDNLDARKSANLFADMMGANPDMLFSDEEMQQRDQAKAAQANAKAQAESLPQAAGAINDLSNSDPDKLDAMLQRFSPAAAVQAGPSN